MNNQFTPHYCHKCGAKAFNSAEFCMACGTRLIKFQQPMQAAQQQKKPSKISSFLLALAKCLGYYGFFLGIQTVVSTIALIAVTIFSRQDPDGAFQIYLSYIHEIGLVSGILTLVGYFLFFKIIKKSFAKETSLKPISLASSGAMVIFGFTAQIIIGTLLALFYAIFSSGNDNSNEAVEMLFENGNVIFQFLNVSILTGILEEVVFRGLIHTTLKKVLPLPLAIFLSSVFFGAAHMNLEQFFYASLLGVLLALVYERTGSLVAPILIHMSFNGSNFLTSYLNFESDLAYIAIFFACTGLFLITAGMIFFTSKKPENSLNTTKEN